MSVRYLLLHPCQRPPDVDERRPVRHGAAPVLHLRLDGLEVVGDLGEGAGTLRHAAADLNSKRLNLHFSSHWQVAKYTVYIGCGAFEMN